MAEKKKKKKSILGDYASTTRKVLPAGGVSEILDTAKALKGVNQGMKPKKKGK